MKRKMGKEGDRKKERKREKGGSRGVKGAHRVGMERKRVRSEGQFSLLKGTLHHDAAVGL